MADLNIRNIPAGLIRRLKVAATLREQTLREFCIMKLEHQLGSWESLKDDKPIGRQVMTGLVKDLAKYVNQHAPNCKCLICKPPK